VGEQRKQSKPVKNVRADRVSVEDASKRPVKEQVCVVREAPVMIDVEGIETYTILCTPAETEALALGFLFSEGVIESMSEVSVLKQCDDDPNTIRVRLTGKIPRIGDRGRNLLIVSSCGACGSEDFEERIGALPIVGDKLRIEAPLLQTVNAAVRRRQSLFDECGGTHAAGIFDEGGKIVACAEDTGRHNALDKAIGKCLMAGSETAGRGVALSGRVSLEMVGKCARAGIELVSAISAPTSMAIDVADLCHITLCAFVRESRATVFTHPERVRSAKR
jgi:FdhD protein